MRVLGFRVARRTNAHGRAVLCFTHARQGAAVQNQRNLHTTFMGNTQRFENLPTVAAFVRIWCCRCRKGSTARVVLKAPKQNMWVTHLLHVLVRFCPVAHVPVFPCCRVFGLHALSVGLGVCGDDQRARSVGRGAWTDQFNHHQPRRESPKKKGPPHF